MRSNSDLQIIEFMYDDMYMLGAFLVRSTTTGETFVIDPSTSGPFVLYFDPEMCCWLLDQSEHLTWDNDAAVWVN